MQGLDNAVVVVTGAGRAIAAGCAPDGAHVVLSARSTDDSELEALLGGRGEWVKDPDDGPTGQMFSLAGRVL